MIYSRKVGIDVRRDRGMFSRVTVTRRPTWLGRALGFTERVEEYRGSGTVWQCLPEWERADSRTEAWLSDVESQWKYGHADQA